MQEEEEEFERLIINHLEGVLSHEEEVRLENWRKSSWDNQQKFEEWSQVWKASGSLSAQTVEVDLDHEFALLEAKMEATSEPEKKEPEGVIRPLQPTVPAKKSPWKLIASLAATVVVLVLVGVIAKPFLTGTEQVEWEEIAAGDEKRVVKLPDGSTVTLNENSSLRFAKGETAPNRDVELTGEAFFEVEKNPDRPFIVSTDAGTITVLGTSFNVYAYPDQAESWVQVRTGKVAFAPKEAPEPMHLLPGEKGIFHTGTYLFTKEENASPNEFAWFSGKLEFVDATFPEIFVQLEKIYGMTVEADSPDLLECPVTSSFPNMTGMDILQELSLSFAFEIEDLGDQKFRLKGGGCQ